MDCFLIVTLLWMLSLCLHEFSHAWVAYRGGDYTVAEKGYLTLNPIRYLHPFHSLVIPLLFLLLGGIGLPGGAVYINRSLLRSRGWDTAVSLAGPAMDLGLILLLGLAFKTELIPPDRTQHLTIALAFLLQIMVGALFLNLLPVPPLDGFQALAPWLPRVWQERIYPFSGGAMFALVLALWFIPPVSHAFWDSVRFVCAFFDVEPAWSHLGYRRFRFWEQ
jgi:Zn-dependent protease